MPAYLVCEGNIDIPTNGNQSPDCETGWVINEAPVFFDISQVDPSQAGMFWSVGFAIAFTPFVASYGIKMVLSLLR